MTDPIGAAIAAAATQSAWAPALAFAAGVATSLGPCVAPRFVAVAALGSTLGAARWRSIAAFSAGLCACYVALGVGSGIFLRVAAMSVYLYALLACALLAMGLRTLWSASPAPCCEAPAPAARSLGGVFLLGASFALVASPCCTPVVVLLGSIAATRSLAFGAALVGAYALGHAVPLAGAGLGWQWIGARADLQAWKPALDTVNGALMLALAGYYGVLA